MLCYSALRVLVSRVNEGWEGIRSRKKSIVPAESAVVFRPFDVFFYLSHQIPSFSRNHCSVFFETLVTLRVDERAGDSVSCRNISRECTEEKGPQDIAITMSILFFFFSFSQFFIPSHTPFFLPFSPLFFTWDVRLSAILYLTTGRAETSEGCLVSAEAYIGMLISKTNRTDLSSFFNLLPFVFFTFY